MEARTVTMEQAQDEALVFGVDDDGEFYGETAEGERLEIAEPATIMCDEGPEDHSGEVAEMVSVQQLQTEARALQAMLPRGERYYSNSARIVFNGDTARAADAALTEAADWEVVKLTVPLPVPVKRTCRRDGTTCSDRR